MTKKNKKVKINEAEKVKNGGMRSAVGECEEADYYISFCSDLFSHIVPYRRIFRPSLCNVTGQIWIINIFRLQKKNGFTLPWGGCMRNWSLPAADDFFFGKE